MIEGLEIFSSIPEKGEAIEIPELIEMLE